MRGRRKTDETRAAILRGAAAVFARREFHEVLTDDIAQHLGVGKGTIYRYFGSKEDLYLATLAQDLDGLHTAMIGVLTEDAPLDAAVEAVVRTTVTYFWRRRDFFLLMARLEPKLKATERADWQRRRVRVIALVRRVFDRAIARGEIPRLNSRLAVEVLLGMIRGVCIYRAESDRPEEVVRLLTAMFLHGVRPTVEPGTTAAPPRLAAIQGGKRSLS